MDTRERLCWKTFMRGGPDKTLLISVAEYHGERSSWCCLRLNSYLRRALRKKDPTLRMQWALNREIKSCRDSLAGSCSFSLRCAVERTQTKVNCFLALQVHTECNKVKVMSLFNTTITKSMKLEEFEQTQSQAYTQVISSLCFNCQQLACQCIRVEDSFAVAHVPFYGWLPSKFQAIVHKQGRNQLIFSGGQNDVTCCCT